MKNCFFKIISGIMIIVLFMCNFYLVVFAEDNQTDSSNSDTNISDVSYELIDGDIRNSPTVTNANKKFNEVLKCFGDGTTIAVILEENTRVSIDYNNSIFKNLTTTQVEEDNDQKKEENNNNNINGYVNLSTNGGYKITRDEPKLKVEIDPLRTRVVNNGASSQLFFYGNYINEKGEKIQSNRLYLNLNIITEGTSYNRILKYNGKVVDEEKTKYVRFEQGMKVGDFKQQYKSIVNNAMKDCYIAYMNNEGKFRIATYKNKIYESNDSIEVKDRNNSNVKLTDSEKIYTGIYIAYDTIPDVSTFPEDLKIENFIRDHDDWGIEDINVVVKGDITGKGEIDITDLSVMQEQIVETTQLEGAYKEAADMNNDKEIDVIDLSEIQEYIVNH